MPARDRRGKSNELIHDVNTPAVVGEARHHHYFDDSLS